MITGVPDHGIWRIRRTHSSRVASAREGRSPSTCPLSNEKTPRYLKARGLLVQNEGGVVPYDKEVALKTPRSWSRPR